MATGSDIFLAVIAVLFPPLPVWVKRGLCSVSSIINILLLLLGFVPGLIHAWYIIFTTPDPFDIYEPVAQNPESGNARGPPQQGDGVRYVYVYQSGGQQQQTTPGQQAPRQEQRGIAPPPRQQGYGTTMPSNGTFGSTEPQPQLAPQQGYQGAAGAAGGSTEVPPAYEEAIRGDNKVQRS